MSRDNIKHGTSTDINTNINHEISTDVSTNVSTNIKHIINKTPNNVCRITILNERCRDSTCTNDTYETRNKRTIQPACFGFFSNHRRRDLMSRKNKKGKC